MAATGQKNRRFFIFRRTVTTNTDNRHPYDKEEQHGQFFETKYLAEARLRIQFEGFTVCEEKDGLLPVEWAGSRVCNVNGTGGITYDPEQIRRNGLEDALERVREIVGDTLAYMRRMETAPPLRADGLSGDYRLLAEYNGTVLVGHQTQYGVQFVTWDRMQDGTLWQGHYYFRI